MKMIPIFQIALKKFGYFLKLPNFEVEGITLWKRITLIVFNGGIDQVFYPVFPPDKNAEDVLNWVKMN